MTPLRKPVRRQTDVLITERGRTRPIAFEARREGLALRQKGTRTEYLLPWRVAYLYASRLSGEQLRAKQHADRCARHALRKQGLAP